MATPIQRGRAGDGEEAASGMFDQRYVGDSRQSGAESGGVNYRPYSPRLARSGSVGAGWQVWRLLITAPLMNPLGIWLSARGYRLAARIRPFSLWPSAASRQPGTAPWFRSSQKCLVAAMSLSGLDQLRGAGPRFSRPQPWASARRLVLKSSCDKRLERNDIVQNRRAARPGVEAYGLRKCYLAVYGCRRSLGTVTAKASVVYVSRG